MIHLEHICKVYRKQPALTDINLQLERGDMAFLTGHSGAGKSTLLKLITLMETPSSGSIWVNGKNLRRIRRRQMPYLRRTIGMISQNPRLLTNRSVFDNVAMPLVIAGYGRTEIGRRVRAALDKVNLLDHEKSHPQTLSSGEQQRVGIARAVVSRPSILLADEPTGNLDPTLSVEIMQLFEAFNQIGTTTLIATHDLALIASLPHRIFNLKNGRLMGGHGHV